MKKLMLLAAVAAMGAISAKAEWTINVNSGEREDGVSTANVEVMAYWESFDNPAKYNNLYVLLESDWDGTVASLDKNLFNMTFQNTSENGGGDIGFYYQSEAEYPPNGYPMPGERTLALVGGIDDDGMVDASAGVYGIFTDVERSGYFAFHDEVTYRGMPEEDLHLEFYLDPNIPDSQPQSFAAAPEPTSGLLLLLGVAGLALKRKRA